ncbi:MAG: CopG family transcriptional regulator [Thermoplasmata archaeon]|nr:CopG family transcriptional regulator [Thermoplasmata archaeon]MBR4244875.1 hypothetical protein [Candidatus Methanomethylophilaceae archaeon]
MVYSIRFSPREEALIQEYADLYQMKISEVIRKLTIEAIEDEIDVKAFEEAKARYEKNPVSYSHEEVGKRLGFL